MIDEEAKAPQHVQDKGNLGVAVLFRPTQDQDAASKIDYYFSLNSTTYSSMYMMMTMPSFLQKAVINLVIRVNTRGLLV